MVRVGDAGDLDAAVARVPPVAPPAGDHGRWIGAPAHGLDLKTRELAPTNVRGVTIHVRTRLLQETSVRGYDQTGSEEFLEPFQRGRRDDQGALATARRHVGDPEVGRRLAGMADVAVRRQALARGAVEQLRRQGPHWLTIQGGRDQEDYPLLTAPAAREVARADPARRAAPTAASASSPGWWPWRSSPAWWPWRS